MMHPDPAPQDQRPTAHTTAHHARHEHHTPGRAGRDDSRRDDDLGRRLRGRLSESVGADRVARLLGTRAAIRCTDAGVEVSVPDRFSAEMVERSLGDALRRSAEEILPGRSVDVRVQDAPPETGTPTPPASRAAGRTRPARTPDASPSGRSTHPTRPTPPAHPAHQTHPAPQTTAPSRRQPGRAAVPEFIVGHANRVAHEAVRRVACEPEAPELVFVHGPCGVGKTHLVRHAAAMARRARRDARIRVTSGELFISGYVNAIQNNAVGEFQKRHRKLDLLVIDDVHVIAGKEGTQQELVRTLNDLHLTGARVILASDAHPRDIARMQAALASRLVSGVVAPIARPDSDLVHRLVPALAKRRGITLEPRGQDMLVQRVLEDSGATVRDIEGTLTQIQAMANLLDRDKGLFLTAEHVRQAVEMRAGERSGIRPGPVGIDRIIDTVCRELGVTRDDLGGKGRAKKVVLAREVIVHLGKLHTGRSYPELAMAIGRPNHSTVITAHQRYQSRLRTEDPIAVNAAFDGITAGELTTRMERAMGV